MTYLLNTEHLLVKEVKVGNERRLELGVHLLAGAGAYNDFSAGEILQLRDVLSRWIGPAGRLTMHKRIFQRFSAQGRTWAGKKCDDPLGLVVAPMGELKKTIEEEERLVRLNERARVEKELIATQKVLRALVAHGRTSRLLKRAEVLLPDEEEAVPE